MPDVSRLKSEPIPLHQDEDGVLRVAGSRVSLLTLLTAYQHGATAEGIVEKFPVLDLPDVYAVITYYLRHRAEIDAYLEKERVDEGAIVNEVERDFPSAGLRERLLKRLETKRS